MLSDHLFLETDNVIVEGSYDLNTNTGVVLYVLCKDAEKPTATIGNGEEVNIAWFKDVGMCAALDTYRIANCKLHTKKSTEISIVRIIPIIPTVKYEK